MYDLIDGGCVARRLSDIQAVSALVNDRNSSVQGVNLLALPIYRVFWLLLSSLVLSTGAEGTVVTVWPDIAFLTSFRN